MEIPQTSPGTFILIRAEVATGIVLNFEDTHYLSEGENYYMIFGSLQELNVFIDLDRNRTSIEAEYSIFDHVGQFIECIL